MVQKIFLLISKAAELWEQHTVMILPIYLLIYGLSCFSFFAVKLGLAGIYFRVTVFSLDRWHFPAVVLKIAFLTETISCFCIKIRKKPHQIFIVYQYAASQRCYK